MDILTACDIAFWQPFGALAVVWVIVIYLACRVLEGLGDRRDGSEINPPKVEADRRRELHAATGPVR